MQRSVWLSVALFASAALVVVAEPASPAAGLDVEDVGTTGSRQETVSVERIGSIDLSASAAESATQVPPSPGSIPRPASPAEQTWVPATANLSPFNVTSDPVALTGQSPIAAVSFPALLDDNTAIPPDTTGAVGPAHVMVTLNSEYKVQDRSGTTLLTLPGAAFWSGFFTTSVFDPRVIYDPLADRWVVVSLADARLATSSFLIAVSDTGDPTGTWTGYVIDGDATDIDWIDFPIVGFNDQWVVVTGNMFTIASDQFTESKIYVFDKAKLYDATISTVPFFADGDAFSLAPYVTNEAGHNTMSLVQNWNGNSGGSGFLRLSTITGTAATPSYSAGTIFPATSSTWATFVFDSDFAPQLGSAELINNGDARIGQPCTYRDGSLWCTHHVFLPASAPTHTSVQWWEINPTTGAVAQFGRIDDPSAQTFYVYPSIAVNQHRDVLIGYSTFSSSQYASAGYSFRSGSDPLNTVQADTVLKAGEAPYFKQYSGTENRWGDYSATVADPNDNDLWTIQEYAATPGGGFDRWGTWWGQVTPGALPPSWPGGSTIDAADVLESSLTLSWSAAEDDRAVTGYRILQDGVVVASSLTQTSTGIAGLLAATPYTFQVEAGDALGQWTSGPSVTVTTAEADVPPSWPGGSTIDAADVLESSLTLSWSAAEDDRAVTGYRILQDGVVVASSLTQTSTGIAGLLAATPYTFQVEAGDALGQWTSGPSVTVTTAEADVPPSWPGGSTIDAADVLESSLTLSWSAAEDDRAVTGYRILQDGVVVASSLTQTSTGIAGLLAATPYTFQVEAGDALGQWTSGPSVTVTMAQDFIDTEGTVFEDDAAWMSGKGITRGCNPPVNDMFCPDEFVTRGQMAAFLVRALDYTDDGGGDLFVDDDGSIFEDGIDRLGTAGVTRGCNPPVNDMFCPDEFVTRGQMAAFLVRALGYTDDGGGDLFVDDDGSIFEDGIDRLGTAGVTRGCNPPTNNRFCPDDHVTRGQMAAFLHRALG